MKQKEQKAQRILFCKISKSIDLVLRDELGRYIGKVFFSRNVNSQTVELGIKSTQFLKVQKELASNERKKKRKTTTAR
jgi:hypothetical protein